MHIMYVCLYNFLEYMQCIVRVYYIITFPWLFYLLIIFFLYITDGTLNGMRYNSFLIKFVRDGNFFLNLN